MNREVLSWHLEEPEKNCQEFSLDFWYNSLVKLAEYSEAEFSGEL